VALTAAALMVIAVAPMSENPLYTVYLVAWAGNDSICTGVS
jgi:hypothetical protein